MDEFEQDPTLISKSYLSFSVGALFEDYGWYILILAVILLYIGRKLQPNIVQYLKRKDDEEYAAKYHKDPDLAAARIAAQEATAFKLQEKYNKDALEYKRKMEEKEVRKREQLLNKGNNSGGHVLGSASQSLKPEYNPLMGDSSRSYRAQKKSPCAGGGCGKK